MGNAIERALTGDGARRALAAFRDIASEDCDSSTFVSQALDRLAELVGSDLTTLSLCDLERQRRTVVSRSGEAVSAVDRATFDRYFREHPLVRFHSTHRMAGSLPTTHASCPDGRSDTSPGLQSNSLPLSIFTRSTPAT